MRRLAFSKASTEDATGDIPAGRPVERDDRLSKAEGDMTSHSCRNSFLRVSFAFEVCPATAKPVAIPYKQHGLSGNSLAASLKPLTA